MVFTLPIIGGDYNYFSHFTYYCCYGVIARYLPFKRLFDHIFYLLNVIDHTK